MNMEVVGWGEARHGQLGMELREEGVVPTPQVVHTLRGKEVEEISCGSCHTVFVLRDGSVYSCGNNDKGQLGQDRGTHQPGMSDVTDSLHASLVSKLFHLLPSYILVVSLAPSTFPLLALWYSPQ